MMRAGGDQRTQSEPFTEQRFLLEGDRLPEFRRLILLLPPDDLDEIGLAEKVWQLCQERQAEILIWGLVPSRDLESILRWKTATMTALLRDPSIGLESKLIHASSWVNVLEFVDTNSDLLIYIDAPSLGSTNLAKEKLIDLLGESTFHVMELTGLIQEEDVRPFRWFIPIFKWVVILGVVAGFFVIQASLIRHYGGLNAMPLLWLSILGEAGLIFLWNGLWVNT